MIENKFLPITLIQETEDFEEYTIDFKDNNLRVKSATLIAFDFLRLVFTSASKSAHQTLSYSRRFFRSIMMDYITLDFYLTIFKICFAIASIGWFFFKTTANLAYEEAWKNVPLHYFASKEIDLEHIVTNFSEIDVSHVPKNVSLNNLLEMFNEIPFYDEKKPGYLPPASRIDDKIDRSPTDLETGIKQFIDNVTNKKAITGAPPAQNIDEFNNFYKKIEDAVRFSIHNSNETIKSFKEKNGEKIEDYTDATLKEYKNISADRSRISLTFACAGWHCGTRYMCDAMEVYSIALGNESVKGNTLKEMLNEILATKRKNIANEEIAHLEEMDRLNETFNFNGSVHHYANYMQTFGKELAIPYTNNIIDPISNKLNRVYHLNRFFEKYTVRCIVETVRENIEKSVILQNKLFDWLKDQCGNWKPKNIDPLNEKIPEATRILNESNLSTDFSLYNSFQELQEFINYLKSQNIEISNNNDNDVADFLNLGNEWFTSKYSKVLAATAKNKIAKLFLAEQLGTDLKDAVFNNKSLETFIPNLLLLQKASKLCGLFTGLNKDTAIRVINKTISLKDAIECLALQNYRNEFLLALNINTNHLSDEILEWLLVSQGILLPQIEE